MSPRQKIIMTVKGSLTTALALMPFILILPGLGIDTGIWPQTEIVSSYLPYGIGAVAFHLLALGLLGDKRTTGSLSSLIVHALLLTALASMALVLLLPEGSTSVFGLNKHGVGGLWFAQIAILAAAYATLPKLGKMVVSTGVLLAFLLCFATYTIGELLPIGPALSFDEWVGILAIASAAVVLWPTPSKTRNFSSFLVAALVLSLGYYVSENRAVLLAVIGLAFVFAADRALPNLFKTPNRRGAFAVFVALSGFAVMYSAAPIIETTATTASRPDTVLSENVLDRAALSKGALGTIWSRSHMTKVIVDQSLSNPLTLLTGRGWGFFPGLYEEVARDVPGRMYLAGNPASANTYWDVHGKANFHSHNMVAESLGALGIIGIMAWCLILWTIAASSKRGLAVASGIAIVGTFWFPLNVMTPVIAFAIGTAIRPTSERSLGQTILPVIGLLAVTSIILGAASLNLSNSVRGERYFKPVQEVSGGNCHALDSKILPDADVHADLMTTLQRRILISQDPKAALIRYRTNIHSLSCALRHSAENESNTRSLATLLESRAKLVSIGGPAERILAKDIELWSQDINLWLTLAPRRSEMIIPFITHLSEKESKKALMNAGIYASVLPDGDPVKSWLKAFMNGTLGREERRKELLRQSLSEGFANIFRVESQMIEELAP